MRQFPPSFAHDARLCSGQRLNQFLAGSQILYAICKKHHWLMREAALCQLHLLLDNRAGEQVVLIDETAERTQTLGVAVGDPLHVAEITCLPRPPNDWEKLPVKLSRLLGAHEMILMDVHDAAAKTAELEDDGTNDPIVSSLTRTNELQKWLLAEHLIDTPLVRA